MPRNVKAPLLAALACAAAVAPLAIFAYWFVPLQRLDVSLYVHMLRGSGPIFILAEGLVRLGDAAALVVMLGAVCWLGLRSGRRREVAAALVVVAGANLTTQILKATIEHARYKAFEHGIELPVANSYPSGHTTAAASIAVALLLVVPAVHRTAALAFGVLLTAAVGISVVVLGWHYPSDTLGAILVAGAWGFAALAYLRLRADRDAAARRGERPPPRHLAVSTD